MTADHVQQTVDEVFVPQLLELKAVAGEVAEQLAVEHNADLFGFFYQHSFATGQTSRWSAFSPLSQHTQQGPHSVIFGFLIFFYRCKKGIAHLFF